MAPSLFRYCALGDSTGVGRGANNDGGYAERLFRRLKATGVPVGILNFAVSGATVRDVLRSQAESAAKKRPMLVTVSVGSNDVWRLVPSEVFKSDLDQLANILEKSGAQVVMNTVFDLSRTPAAGVVENTLGIPRHALQHRVEELNQAIHSLARRPRFHIVDVFTAEQDRPEYFAEDGFHPSAKGYDRWAELLWPTVQSIARQWKETADHAATAQPA